MFMPCILTTSDGKAAEGAEDHSDDTGDDDTGEEGADYDNTRDTRGDNGTRDTRAGDANRCNAQEERENQNQGPVKKAAQARGPDNCLMYPLTHRVEGPPMRSSELIIPLQKNTSSNI